MFKRLFDERGYKYDYEYDWSGTEEKGKAIMNVDASKKNVDTSKKKVDSLKKKVNASFRAFLRRK